MLRANFASVSQRSKQRRDKTNAHWRVMPFVVVVVFLTPPQRNFQCSAALLRRGLLSTLAQDFQMVHVFSSEHFKLLSYNDDDDDDDKFRSSLCSLRITQ